MKKTTLLLLLTLPYFSALLYSAEPGADYASGLPVFRSETVPMPGAAENPAQDKNRQPLFPFAEEFFAKFKDISAEAQPALRGKAAPAAAAQKPVARLELKAMLDEYMLSNLTFKTRKGKKLHVSFTKVMNCPSGNKCDDENKYFLVFTDSDKTDIFGASAYEVTTYLLKRGKKALRFDNDKTAYTVRLYLNGDDAYKSTVEITSPAGLLSTKTHFKATVGDIVDAMSKKAVKVKLSRKYMVFYGRAMSQDRKKNLLTDKSDPVFLFIPENDQSEYYLISSSKISAAGVKLPSIDKNYIFRMANGYLEIFRK